MTHFFIILVLFFIPANSSFADENCNKALESYLVQLESHRSKVLENQQLLEGLTTGTALPAEKLNDIFGIDFHNAEQRNQLLAQLLLSSENPSQQAVVTNRPTTISQKCLHTSAKVVTAENQLFEQIKVNQKLRADILNLPEDKLASLIKPTSTGKKEFSETSSELKSKLQTTEANKKEIQAAAEKATIELEKAETSSEKSLAKLQLAIESYRSDLASASIQWLEELKFVVDKYESISNQMSTIEASLVRDGSEIREADLDRLYQNTTTHWRTLIDDGYSVYHRIKASEKVNAVPRLVHYDFTQATEDQKRVATELIKTAEDERQKFIESRLKLISEHFDEFYLLLARVSKIRSELISKVSEADLNIIQFDQNYITDLFREIIAIPFRFFGIIFQKYIIFEASLSKGFWGVLLISKNIFIFLLILLVPFLSRRTADRIKIILDQQRIKLLKQRHLSDRKHFRYALWIQRITPYAPWLLYGIILRIFHAQIEGTSFEQLQIIVPILGYLIVYRIFRNFISDIFYSIRNLARKTDQNTRLLINQTSKTIGYFFLIAFIILHLTEQTVDKGLLYRNVSGLLDGFGLLVFVLASYWWRDYLSPAVKSLDSGKIGIFLSEKCNGKWAIAVALPTLLYIVSKIAIDASWGWISNWEFTKRFMAKIYRKKIESIVGDSKSDGSESLPSAYSNLFSGDGLADEKFFVDANAMAFKIISDEIKGWLSEEEEDQSVAIYGENGIGKTTLIDQIAREFHDLNVIRISIPPKIFQRENLAQFICDTLEIEKTDNLLKAILEFNKSVEKKSLILVDNAHNLFLGKYGGFEAFQSYIEAVNIKTDKIFWCSVFNEYAWAYLKGVLGSSQYLRTEVYMDQWTDKSIKDLILKRHKDSGYQLSYDQMILASRISSSNDQIDARVHAEEQFFRLLWEQSKGNPRVALYLWTNSLSISSSKTLKVGLPEKPEAAILSKLDDNSWFVLAAIAKQVNLTRNEVVNTTNLAWPQVAHAIKLGVENKLLHRDGNRYRLHYTHQHEILKQLRMKNFIYGIR